MIGHDKMDFRRSGKSGLMLPVLSLGFWHNFGSNDDFENMRAIVRTAVEGGITHLDLANNYGPEGGAAELNLGRILREDLNGLRDQLLISTKAGFKMWDGPYGDFGSRKYLIASIDQSLERLGLDYVDIFYHHRPDPDTPLEETALALDQIVRSGKALYIGLSNYDGETVRKMDEIFRELKTPYIINQNCYNIFNRTVEENGLKKASRELGKGLICYSPLAQGLLTDRYLKGIPEDSRIRKDGRFLKESDLTEDKMSKIAKLNGIALEGGRTLSELAICWLLSKGAASVLVGASKAEQIRTNLGIVGREQLSTEEMACIDNVIFS